MNIVRTFSHQPCPILWGELFARHLYVVNQSQFVSHTKFQETSACCSLSLWEKARVRGNKVLE